MKIHLVGGFLGSGKTTAITTACKILSEQGVTASVITNDQGNYLVDSWFMRASEISYGEVTGGCFCCNYSELDAQINLLKKRVNPSVIFAESVGSCTDLVATVIKPLLKFRQKDFDTISFSCFADAQLLLQYLNGKSLPFKEETNYIWEKQIEEAEMLIVSKSDLLSGKELQTLQSLVKDFAPLKTILFQNSLDTSSVTKWMDVINNFVFDKEQRSMEVDYDKYGAGEANLAWLDEVIEIRSENRSAVKVAYRLIEELTNNISGKELPIGHLKFLLSSNNQSSRISFTTILKRELPEDGIFSDADLAELMINARIETSPNELRDMVADIIAQMKHEYGVTIMEKNISSFQPGFPAPEYRMA